MISASPDLADDYGYLPTGQDRLLLEQWTRGWGVTALPEHPVFDENRRYVVVNQ